MNKTSTYLTPFQLSMVIIQAQLGLGSLSLPYHLFLKSGADGWISLIIAGIGIQILLTIYYLLLNSQKETLLEIAYSFLGKHFGKTIAIGYFIYFAYSSFVVLVTFSNIMDTWVLKLTPRWVVLLPLVLLSIYLVRESLILIARFFVIVSILIIFLVSLLLIAFTNFHYEYLFPIGQSGIQKILEGSLASVNALLGFEILLFIFPFIGVAKDTNKKKKKSNIYLSISLANLFTILLYVFICILCFTFFSADEIVLVPLPVLYMLKAFTSTIVDRVDLLFIPMWCTTVITTFMCYLYLSSISLAKLLNLKEHSSTVAWVGLLIFIFSIIPTNNLSIDILTNSWGKISLIFVVAIPILLYLIYFVKRKWRSKL